MKTAIDNEGNEVEISDDTTVRTSGGIHYLLTPTEQAEYDAKNAEWAAGKTARTASAKISELEDQVSNRRMREAVADTEDPVNWLADQELLIATERAKL